MAKFDKLLKKLQPVQAPSDLVTDPYDEEAMNRDVSQYTKQLSPEDLEKIHYAETTGGVNLQNPESSASGHYQIINKTRKLAEKLAKEQEIDENTANPLRKDAILMKALAKKYENVLENAKKGPFEPNLENMYLMHKGGIQSGLNTLGDPENPTSEAKFKEVRQLLARKPKSKEKEQKPAKNLLELLNNK